MMGFLDVLELAGSCLGLLVLSKTLVRSGLKSNQEDLSRLHIRGEMGYNQDLCGGATCQGYYAA